MISKDNYKDINITVKDNNLIGSEDMGYCEINWKKAIENPGTWLNDT